MKNCKYCGTELLENTSFCVKCGKNNAESAVQETKKKTGGFFAGLFKRDKQNDIQNEISEEIIDGGTIGNFSEKEQVFEVKNVEVTPEESVEKIIKNSDSLEQIVTTEGQEVCNDNKETIILKTTKVIGQTDVKYNICTFGAKFHIGFGVPVTIRMGCNEYSCKTHNSAKGRIDGMKRLYTENNIVLGDAIEAIYNSDTNTIEMTKN